MLAERVGIIDLGTNSIRFDIHAVSPHGHARLLHRERLMVRLGEAVFVEGSLSNGATHRTLEALRRFKHIASELDTHRIVAFGTSTLREARDSERFVRKVRKATGIRLQIISGEEEARLIAAGILSKRKGLQGKFGLVDIGGGSTEISVCQNNRIRVAESFPLGVARLQQVFLKTIPPETTKHGASTAALRKHIRGILRAYVAKHRWPQVSRIIGSSGTIKALAKIAKRQTGEKVIERSFLKNLIKQMTPMTVQELLAVPGMEAKRVDLILAGAIVLAECMDALGAESVSATNFALRDGILRQEMLRLYKKPMGNPFQWALWYKHARKFGGDPARLRTSAHEGDRLFDKLQKLHRLSPRWKNFLIGAVILRDTGWFISPLNYAVHSSYIVRHLDLVGLEDWERELIAHLCLKHEAEDWEVEWHYFPSVKLKEDRHLVFLKLLALLKIVDSLDPNFNGIVRIRRVEISRREVVLRLSPGTATELTQLRIQDRKDLFEELFSKKLRVEIT